MRRLIVSVVCVVGVLFGAGAASADPLPGYSLDLAQLEDRMQRCVSYESSDNAVLMAWVNFSEGATRTWRCSSLRHMLFDDVERTPHDPFVDVPNFMSCVDRVVSYGFSRPADAGKTRYIYQYNGTADTAIVVVNDDTGDVVTIYTRKPNDWAGCAA